MSQTEQLEVNKTEANGINLKSVQQEEQTVNVPRIIQITEKGSRELAELLMQELGYIDNEEFERVKDRLEEWINVQCGALALFYIKARQNGLVPSNEPTDEIPKEVRRIKKGTTVPGDVGVIGRFVNFLKRRSNSE